MHHQKLAYRSDIDGLRAVAVILVLIYHAFPTVIPGGFIGVDVFFVISGYLITSIILNEIGQGGFSYGSFYSRRIRRLFPVLLIVAAASLVAGWSLLLDVEYAQLAKHAIAGLAFASNINLWTEINYFDSASELKPLLHLWSLGVEEQFYLLWPAIVMALAPTLIRSARLVVAIFVVMFLVCGLTAYFSKEAAFYLPFARFWELFAGAGLAFREKSQQHHDGKLKVGLLNSEVRLQSAGIVGLALIVFAAFAIDKAKSFPFPLAILPVAGATLLLMSKDSVVNRYVLASRSFVAVGLISYSLYIWHWPLLSFLRIVFNGTPTVEWRLLALASAFGLSAVCYWTVEKWFRSTGRERSKLSIIFVLSAILIAAAANIYLRNGLGFRMDSVISDVIGPKSEHHQEWRSGECFIDQESKDMFASSCVGQKERPDVFLWGDSYAAALYPGIASQIESHGYSLAQYTGARCKPFLSGGDLSSVCIRNNSGTLKIIEKYKPRLVVLAGRWDDENDLANLEKSVARLNGLGVKRIALIGPWPHWSDSLPRLVFSYYRKHRTIPPQWQTDCNVDATKNKEASFAAAARKMNLGYISFSGVLYSPKGCPIRTSESSRDIMMFDAGHLTVSGSHYVAPYVWKQLEPHLRGSSR